MRLIHLLLCLICAGCTVLPGTAPPKPAPVPSVEIPPKPEVHLVPPRIALALGGGAARGFAHIGVIKALEAHGIVPDMVIGTSAGSLVGALYASGYGGFDLQRTALQLDDSIIADWSMPDRGFIKGEALQNFVNQAVQNRVMEKLNKPFAVVATDLQSGEPVVFRTGNTGMAVRASSSVPGVFQPVTINGHEYVDGGLVSPVPVRAARAMGADLVIAVYISNNPRMGKTRDSVDLMLQSFAIMGQSIAGYELPEADIVIRPDTGRIRSTGFEDRHLAIIEGRKRDWRRFPPSSRRSRRRRSASVVEQQAARAVETLFPVAFLHVGNFHLAAAAGRVHEALVADIDADMGIGAPARVEEYEVAGLQIGLVDFRADLAHGLRIARQHESRDLLEDMTDETAAVEPALRIGTAPFVVDADEGERLHGDFARALKVAIGYRRGRGWRSYRGGCGCIRRQGGRGDQHERQSYELGKYFHRRHYRRCGGDCKCLI